MTIRADHVAGGVFILLALLVFALSGDLPFGTLSFPGAGMMPKLVAVLMILLAASLMLRAGESPPLATLGWGDARHAARVMLITAVAVALYPTLGFIVTMTLLLFTLICVAERRNALAAAGYAAGITLLTYLLFSVALKTPLDIGIFGI
jgi:putative tricarboxylic transport membrane protein